VTVRTTKEEKGEKEENGGRKKKGSHGSLELRVAIAVNSKLTHVFSFFFSFF
jgi:hypothetical protein